MQVLLDSDDDSGAEFFADTDDEHVLGPWQNLVDMVPRLAPPELAPAPPQAAPPLAAPSAPVSQRAAVGPEPSEPRTVELQRRRLVVDLGGFLAPYCKGGPSSGRACHPLGNHTLHRRRFWAVPARLWLVPRARLPGVPNHTATQRQASRLLGRTYACRPSVMQDASAMSQ